MRSEPTPEQLDEIKRAVLAFLKDDGGEMSSGDIGVCLRWKYHPADILRVLTYLNDDGAVELTRNMLWKAVIRKA